MSLWLQAATNALHERDYDQFRRILPIAPIPIPTCMLREVKFAQRFCRAKMKARLFPIRFLWLLAASEQQHFGLNPPSQSLYHPEKLIELWTQACISPQFRQERENKGISFDFNETAMKLSGGWIYVGQHFAADFLVSNYCSQVNAVPQPLQR
jgi:hypothetical protein